MRRSDIGKKEPKDFADWQDCLREMIAIAYSLKAEIAISFNPEHKRKLLMELAKLDEILEPLNGKGMDV